MSLTWSSYFHCGGRGYMRRCGACARDAPGRGEHTLYLTGKKRGFTSNMLGSKLLESTLRACHTNQTTIYFGQDTSIVERSTVLLIKTEKSSWNIEIALLFPLSFFSYFAFCIEYT